MNIAEEKVFLYGMMKDITEERRRLTDQYFSLKERVDTLIKLEEKGIGELSTKGFIDLFNDRETQLAITNMNREVQHVIARREEKQLATPRYDRDADLLERGQAEREKEKAKAEVEKRDRIVAWEKKEQEMADKEQEMIEQALRENEQVTMLLAEENAAKKSDYVAPVENVIPKALVEEAKGRENKVTKGKHRKERVKSGLKTTEAIFFISKILKESGRPMKALDIHQKLMDLSGFEIEKKNFTGNVFQRVLKAEPRIERVTPGFYQFNKNKEV